MAQHADLPSIYLLLLLQPDAPKNPRAVAESIVAALPSTEYLQDKPTLAGPGFINAKISSQWLGVRIQNMLRQGIKTWAPRLNRKRVVVDFSSPNVAKEMHVGHLRSTIIGDTVSRTLEFCGADVLRLNHIVSPCSLTHNNRVPLFICMQSLAVYTMVGVACTTFRAVLALRQNVAAYICCCGACDAV